MGQSRISMQLSQLKQAGWSKFGAPGRRASTALTADGTQLAESAPSERAANLPKRAMTTKRFV